MPLLNRTKDDRDARVKEARFEVNLALLRMTQVLDRVERQAAKAKEELDERRTG